jgi:DNA-binding phage protein
MARIAGETKLKRENLYAMLSEHGNSVLSSLKLEEGTQEFPLDANINRYSLRCIFLDKLSKSL